MTEKLPRTDIQIFLLPIGVAFSLATSRKNFTENYKRAINSRSRRHAPLKTKKVKSIKYVQGRLLRKFL